MIKLEKKYLDEIQVILRKHVPGCEVRAFGSRIDGSARKYSDLDLAVVGEGPLSFETMDNIKEAFSESDLPIIVDVLDWHVVSEEFRLLIEKKYEVIQKAEESFKQ